MPHGPNENSITFALKLIPTLDVIFPFMQWDVSQCLAIVQQNVGHGDQT
jgi:hypothetical protein